MEKKNLQNYKECDPGKVARPKTEAECQGAQIFALVSRAGGRFDPISKLAIYQVTDHGTMKFLHPLIPIVANRGQVDQCCDLVEGFGFISGRPKYRDVVRRIMAGTLR